MSQYIRYPSNGASFPSGATANQLLGENAAATGQEWKSLLGTAAQVVVTNNVGSITLSLPQSIGTGNTPTFGGLSLGGNLLPTSDSAYDIGSLTGPARFRDLFIGRNGLIGGDLHVQGALTVDGAFAPASVLLEGNGSIGAPAYSFSSQPTLGFYKKAANTLGFTGNGSTGINFAGTTIISNDNVNTYIDFNENGVGRLGLHAHTLAEIFVDAQFTYVGFVDESHGCSEMYGYLLFSNTYGTSGMDIYWQTDGGGNIGRSSARPNLGLFKSGLGVGLNSLDASATLQADSTSKGFLPPRMTTTQKNAIASPAAGLVVYDTTLSKLCVFTTAWETITSI